MKTKKCGVFAATAVVLLFTAALITNCMDPLDSGGLGNSQKATKTGTGIQLIIKGIDGRTILPDSSQTFSSYEVDVESTGSDSSGDKINQSITVSGGASTIAMPAGTYNVKLRAYNTVDSVQTLAAQGTTASPVTVSTGSVAAPIALKPVSIDPSEKGVFKWNLTLPTVTSASMTVTKGGASAITALDNVDLTTANTSPTAGYELASGVYEVKITVARTGGYRGYTLTDIFHIYPGLTTTFAKTDFSSLARNVYSVTYANIIGLADTGTGNTFLDSGPGDGWLHDTKITMSSNAAIATPTADPSLTGYVFDSAGWYKTPARVVNDTWDFDTDLIIKDTILYAKWIPPGASIGLTVTFSAPEDEELTFVGGDAQDIEHSDLVANPNVVIEFSNHGDFDSVAFELDATPLASSAWDASTGMLTLGFSPTGSIGESPIIGHKYVITVKVVKGVVTYTGFYSITIKDTP